MFNNKKSGSLAEDLVAQYLIRQWLKLLDRNWKCFLGELDLVARDPKSGELVFIEVKARYGEIDLAWEALHQRKRARLKRLALVYLKNHRLPLETRMRFDVALVDLTTKEIRYEPNAFLFDSEL